MTAKKRSITLPAEMAEYVERKLASGEYGSESEVLHDGLRALQARDQAVEAWLRDEVAAAYDAMEADPSRLVSIADVRARLATGCASPITKSNTIVAFTIDHASRRVEILGIYYGGQDYESGL